jgi:Trk-type K+ transport system membrane component
MVKILLTLFMILGRLEFYAVVVLFVPGFWKL